MASTAPGHGCTPRMYFSFHSSPRYFFSCSPNFCISRALSVSGTSRSPPLPIWPRMSSHCTCLLKCANASIQQWACWSLESTSVPSMSRRMACMRLVTQATKARRLPHGAAPCFLRRLRRRRDTAAVVVRNGDVDGADAAIARIVDGLDPDRVHAAVALRVALRTQLDHQRIEDVPVRVGDGLIRGDVEDADIRRVVDVVEDIRGDVHR